jgi:hypothetical protein
MTEFERERIEGLAHSDSSQRYLYPHAARFGEHVGRKLAGYRMPNVATYTVGHGTPTQRYVATFEGHVTENGAPKVADRCVTIFASNRENAERCAEHIARDEVWYLLGLSEDA